MSWSQRYPTINNADLQQRVARLVNLGTVLETDYEHARVKVTVGQWTTTWLPWLTASSGNNVNWQALEIGEQVLVLSPGGDMAQGVVLGSLYQANQQQLISDIAKDERAHTNRWQFADGTIIEYDRNNHKLKADVKGDVELITEGQLTATISKNAIIKAQNITLEAEQNIHVKAGGDMALEASGNMKLNAAHISAQE